MTQDYMASYQPLLMFFILVIWPSITAYSAAKIKENTDHTWNFFGTQGLYCEYFSENLSLQ